MATSVREIGAGSGSPIFKEAVRPGVVVFTEQMAHGLDLTVLGPSETTTTGIGFEVQTVSLKRHSNSYRYTSSRKESGFSQSFPLNTVVADSGTDAWTATYGSELAETATGQPHYEDWSSAEPNNYQPLRGESCGECWNWCTSWNDVCDSGCAE